MNERMSWTRSWPLSSTYHEDGVVVRQPFICFKENVFLSVAEIYTLGAFFRTVWRNYTWYSYCHYRNHWDCSLRNHGTTTGYQDLRHLERPMRLLSSTLRGLPLARRQQRVKGNWCPYYRRVFKAQGLGFVVDTQRRSKFHQWLVGRPITGSCTAWKTRSLWTYGCTNLL